MAVEGSLDLFQLPEILQIISQEQKTGILTVQGKEDIVAISFLKGRVVAADALNQTLEDGLGQILLERRLLSQEAYDAVLEEKRRSQGRLIDVLVETKTLERDEVLDALRILTLDLLGELLDWREGEFKFYGGDEVSYEEGFRPIEIEDLLLANLPQATEMPVSDPAPGEVPVAPEEPPPEKPPPDASPELSESVLSPVLTASGGSATSAASEPQPPDLGQPRLSDFGLRAPEPASAAPAGPSASAPVAAPAEERWREPAPVRRKTVRRPSTGAGRQPLAWALALIAATALVVILISFPTRFLLPSVSEERQALDRSRANASYSKIERALRSYALMEARLPDQLEELTHLHLLSPEEVRGPLAQPLLYEVDGLVYTLRPLLTDEDAAFAGSLTGDFLRDPSLVRERDTRTVPPLELLD